MQFCKILDKTVENIVKSKVWYFLIRILRGRVCK